MKLNDAVMVIANTSWDGISEVELIIKGTKTVLSDDETTILGKELMRLGFSATMANYHRERELIGLPDISQGYAGD
jgi:hypothetical protein